MKNLIIVILINITLSCFCQTNTNPTDFNYKSYESLNLIDWKKTVDTTKKVVLISEVHEVKCNSELTLSLITNLVNLGYNNLLLEYPFSYGYICNNYLETGDTSLLNFICNTIDKKNFWSQLYLFNRQLVEDQKIKVWGIDFELDGGRRSLFFQAALKKLVEDASQNHKMDNAVKSAFEKIINEANQKQLVSLIKVLNDPTKSDNFKQIFGTNYPIFETLVGRRLKFQSNRDSNMYENFLEIFQKFISKRKNQKIMGQFGYVHVGKSKQETLGMLMQTSSNSPANNSVWFIGTQYINCYSNLPTNSNFYSKNSGVIRSESLKNNLFELNKSDSSKYKILDFKSTRFNIINDCDILILFSNIPGTTLISSNKNTNN